MRSLTPTSQDHSAGSGSSLPWSPAGGRARNEVVTVGDLLDATNEAIAAAKHLTTMDAGSVEAYLDALPEDRREAIAAVRLYLSYLPSSWREDPPLHDLQCPPDGLPRLPGALALRILLPAPVRAEAAGAARRSSTSGSPRRARFR